MPSKIEKDSITGKQTTGHEWDGIRELDTPLPKWWLYTFVATIIWAIGYFILYPSIPLGTTYFHGLLGYSTRATVMQEVREINDRHAAAMAQIGKLSFDEIRKDPNLMAVALTAGRITFANNCQPCHGQNGEGHVGYPALGDDVWLWGGTLADIQHTISVGVRSGDADARVSQMPNFGTDGMLKPEQIQQVADYVMTLYGKTQPGPDVAAGRQLFAENCAACHGENGQGNREVGAPPLASSIHLYGGDRATVVAQITHPRQGVMPNWNGRLSDATIKSLALYVHSLGGGQ